MGRLCYWKKDGMRETPYGTQYRARARLEAETDRLLRNAPAPVREEPWTGVTDEEARAALTYWLNRAKRGRETVDEARARLGLDSGD